MTVSVFDLAQFALGAAVTGTGGGAQQVMTDTTVAGVATFTAHQLPQAALRGDHPFTRRLLEQTPGEVFDVGVVAQARAVEQPQGDLQGKALGCGNSLRSVGNRR